MDLNAILIKATTGSRFCGLLAETTWERPNWICKYREDGCRAAKIEQVKKTSHMSNGQYKK